MAYKILVPLDGSLEAEAALAEAERIAVSGAEIHLLHVVPSFPLRVGAPLLGMVESAGALGTAEGGAGVEAYLNTVLGEADPSAVDRLNDEARSYLQGVRERIPEVGGFDRVRSGEPVEAILDVALTCDMDLIAMSTHGRTGLTKWYLGSVAETVVRRARLPVLLTRLNSPEPRGVLRRILVPLDGSAESLMILSTVKRLALTVGAEVILLQVTPPADGRIAPPVSEHPMRRLEETADRLERGGVVAWPLMAEGDAAEEILKNARSLDADLIAMATHARSGKERRAAGSVAQSVLARSDRAVLLEKPVI